MKKTIIFASFLFTFAVANAQSNDAQFSGQVIQQVFPYDPPKTVVDSSKQGVVPNDGTYMVSYYDSTTKTLKSKPLTESVKGFAWRGVYWRTSGDNYHLLFKAASPTTDSSVKSKSNDSNGYDALIEQQKKRKELAEATQAANQAEASVKTPKQIAKENRQKQKDVARQQRTMGPKKPMDPALQSVLITVGTTVGNTVGVILTRAVYPNH